MGLKEISFYKRILVTVLILMEVFIALPVKVRASGVTSIDSATFRETPDITTIHIGSDVTEISPNAFRGLMALRSITVSESNPFYSSYCNCLYNKEKTELLCFPAALTGAYIPETVTSIGKNALYGVADSLRTEIRHLVEAQAQSNLMEWQVPGEHFIHTPYGVKWKDAAGNTVEPDTDLKKLIASVLETSTTESMSQRQQLEYAFNYLVDSVSYERKMDVPIGNWTGSYATDMLLNGKGNCYGYAAAFAYIAKGLGFDSRVCSGMVQSSLGGKTPHAWTEVKLGDKWYIFDSEMQDAKGEGYYKQTYDSYPAKPLEKQLTWTVYY
ncbi:Leucine rich repeat-containing protein [Butyrivibrio proteoclasticus]|uniref:Leucine rich repeat-containing protein n=1 Tax=Butyrivibrio proteoclasticus TaxID=43305 RepID=A0A1I5X9I2_9FIRM|nr:transglutaminase domain-containing protein [Butyrivibrio proteoclasticus]SFQ28630.1 Leucine rich repeat-containing protein [Butyrivibrio proteoclasticus]